MSSTSSSPETLKGSGRTPAEYLAGRYRHLFVLPSTPLIVVYAVVASVLLSVAASRGSINLTAITLNPIFLLAAAGVVSALSKLDDNDSIATFRRITAALFGGQGLWAIFTGFGFILATVAGNFHLLANSLVFGAFATSGFEFIIINGAFARSSGLSAVLAWLHPALTMAAFALAGVYASIDWYAAALGFAAWAVLISFILELKRKRTSKNHDSVSVFRAFMKTWAGGRSEELERIILDHSEQVPVSTKVIKLRQGDHDIYLVLPGVHPGPFHPVGSYNLPGLIRDKFLDTGPVMVLHRPGGHDKNIASREGTAKYVSEVYDFAKGIQAGPDFGKVKGPITSSIGGATVTSIAFRRDALTTVSFAPAGSEDLEPEAEETLSSSGALAGFDVSVVDAHNSIDPNISTLNTSDPGWSRLFEELRKSPEDLFQVGYANSDELGFKHKDDVTKGGIGVLLLSKLSRKWALVLADANNAEPSLRQSVAAALRSAGYDLFELCTTDSHDFAARGLTIRRGYYALGEATPIKDIASIATEVAKAAERRLGACKVGSGTLVTRVNAFGTKALHEFDELTRSGSNFGRNYVKMAVPTVLILYAAALIV